MYAVINSGGKQYRVASGNEVKLEHLLGEVGDTVIFDRVLLTADGENVSIGRPYLDNSKVVGRITRQGKDRKIVVFKYKAKVRTRKKTGHRQKMTRVAIRAIDTGEG